MKRPAGEARDGDALLPGESGFVNVDQTNDPSEYVCRLDRTGGQEFWQQVKRRMQELLAPQEGDHILDVGCGTGDDVRALLTAVGPAGRVVGVDASATMVTEARKRAAEANVAAVFHQQDAHTLPFPDQSFDGCRAERVLQHIHDPDLVLAEMRRVLRPGGRLVVAEPDYGAAVIRGADKTVTSTILGCRRDHYRSGRIGRQLPEMFRKLGLVDLSITFMTISTVDCSASGERDLVGKYATEAHALGVVARPKGMTQIANETGLSREQLYRSFSENGNPTLKTTIAVMTALGIELTAKVHS